MGNHTFLREIWNIILLVILISGWISKLDQDYLSINIIKNLRILTFFRLFPQLMDKVNAFFSSFRHLGKTFFPLICVVAFYAVIGMSFFHGHAESRCRLTEHPEHGSDIWEVDEKNELPCGYLSCPTGTYCGNPADYGLPFNKKEAKAESLLFGYNLFNSIEWALFAVYNFLMVTGWIQTIYMYWRAQDKAVSAIYFVSLVLFLSQVISNIILATLYEGFIDQTSIKNQKQQAKLKKSFSLSDKDSSNQQALDSGKSLQKKSLVSIGESEENDDENKDSKYIDSDKYPPSIQRHLPQDNIGTKQESFAKQSPQKEASPKNKLENNIYLVSNPVIRMIFLSNIFLQILVLCLDNHWISNETYVVLNKIDFATIIFLLLETIFIIYKLGIKSFIRDLINLIDVCILVVHIVSYIVEISKGQDIFNPTGQIYLIIRCTKVFRFFKIFFHYELFQNMTIILKTYYQTLKSIPEYIILFCILVVLFAQIGRELFAHVQPHDDHHVLRVNFDTLADSIVSVVLIFYNEEWHVSMYNYMRFVGYKSVIYYLVCMLIGWVLYVRLFIAIFISQFMKWLRLNEQEFENKKNYINTFDMLFKRCWISICNVFNNNNSNYKRKVNISTHPSSSINKNQVLKIENLDHHEKDKQFTGIENGLFSHKSNNLKQDMLVSPTTYNQLNSGKTQSDTESQDQDDQEEENMRVFAGRGRGNKKPTIIGIRNSILRQDKNKNQNKQGYNNTLQLHPYDFVQTKNTVSDINVTEPHQTELTEGIQGTLPTERNIFSDKMNKQNNIDLQIKSLVLQDDYIEPKQNSKILFNNQYYGGDSKQFNPNEREQKLKSFVENDDDSEDNNNNKAINQLQMLNENSKYQLESPVKNGNHTRNVFDFQPSSYSIGIGLSNQQESKQYLNMFGDLNKNKDNLKERTDNINIVVNQPQNTNAPHKMEHQKSILRNESMRSNQASRQNHTNEQQDDLYNISLNLFKKDFRIRLFCIRISKSSIFDIFLAISIIVFAGILVWDSPFLDPKSREKAIIYYVHIALAVIFSLQSLINFISYGMLFNGPQSYLRSNIFHILDFFTTVAIILYLIDISRKATFVFKCLSVFKIIFLLYFLSKYNKDIAFAGRLMAYCFPRMIKLICFAIIYLLMNSILITKLLKDSSWKCKQYYHPSSHDIISRHDCYDLGGDWIESQYNFNSIVDSLQVLFMVQASEGWLQIMLDTFDSNTSEFQLIYRQQSIWAIFFIQYFFIANICILNMFVGLIVESLIELLEHEHGTHALTKQQKEWHFIKKSINKLIPFRKAKEPKNQFRNLIFRHLITGVKLKLIFYGFIVLNSVSFLFFKNRMDDLGLNILSKLQQQKQNLNIQHFLYVGMINLTCLIAMGIEILLRLLSLGFSQYFKYGWNIFDILALVVGCININYQINEHITIFSNYYRIFDGIAKGLQFLRLIRVQNHFLVFRKLFNSLNYALSSIFGISLILIVFLYSAVLLSLNLFPYLKFQSTINSYDINFQGFFQALFSFIRIVTLEMWYLIPFEASKQVQPDFVCRHDMYSYEDFVKYGYQSCGSVISYLFFYGFFLIFTLIILNLFIATIIESYKEAFSADESAINHYQLDDILNLWTKFDPYGKGYINYKEFWQFSSQIAIIYGVNSSELLDIENKNKFLKSLDVPIYEDPVDRIFCYKFHDVVVKLSKISVQIKYGVRNLEPKNKKLRDKLDSLIKATNIKGNSNIKSTSFTSGDMILMIVLTRKAKQWKKQYLKKEKENVDEVNIFHMQSLIKRVQDKKTTFIDEIKKQIQKEQEGEEDKNNIQKN